MVSVLVSCDTGFQSKGLVLDKSTQLPINNVKIDIKGRGITYTDSIGHYKIDTMIYGYAGNLEILVKKDGYKAKHVNFKLDKIKMDNALIELDKIENSVDIYYIKENRISQFYYFNLYCISLFTLLTLLFLIIKKKIKWKILWILAILLINLTFFVSITDCSISDFKIINSPFHLMKYWLNPYSFKIVIPIFSIAFWILYFTKKSIIVIDDSMNSSSEK